MSQIETHIGKIRKLSFLSKNEENFADIDIEEWIKQKCVEEGIQKRTYHKSWLDAWNDTFYKETGYILSIKGEYYEIVEDIDIEDEDITYISKNRDDTYSYVMRFYNGWTCLSEMLEEGVNSLKESEL